MRKKWWPDDVKECSDSQLQFLFEEVRGNVSAPFCYDNREVCDEWYRRQNEATIS